MLRQILTAIIVGTTHGFAPLPMEAAKGSVCYPPPVVGQCGATSRPSSGLECKCFTISPVHGLPEEICTCEPKSPYLDTECNIDFVGTCGSLEGYSSGLTCQCEIFCSGCQETCTCRPEQPPPPVPPPSPSPPSLSPPPEDTCTDEPAKNCKKKKCKKSYSDEEKQQCKKTCDLCGPVYYPGSSCEPGLYGVCGAGTRYPPGLLCLQADFLPPAIGSTFKCLPKSAKPYINTICKTDFVGTCGSSLPEPSGLTCQAFCAVIGCTEGMCRFSVA